MKVVSMAKPVGETLPQLAVDKSDWGDGPWQTEPDREQWSHAGLACLAVRNPRHGYWCGYVGVPQGHPAYGIDPRDHELDVPFHCGGLNYGAPCGGLICHVPELGMPADVWWLGGDFGRLFDLAPAIEARLRRMMEEADPDRAALLRGPEVPDAFREIYRELPYVRGVVNKAADVLAAMGEDRCTTCGCSLAHVAGPGVTAVVCPVCDADSSVFDGGDGA
jgi:hypothetical protein